ncbi:uncharacterized protein LOC135218050 [Macrobrachium nipponense]|uniref:uncharacterized protein LOC135218050 n=1 Tax=Macrobrachium nipponense TaxID=159736 RepID=UPI0030C8BA7E
MGDLNAKVGREYDGFQGTIGKFGIGVRNDNRRRLLELCGASGLSITNTYFNHKLEHKTTWVSPNGLVQNLIDYVIVNQKWKKSILDTRTFRGCRRVPSDHKLVISKIRIKIQANQEKRRTIKFDVDNLRNERVKQQYEVKVGGKFAALIGMENMDMDSEESWAILSSDTKDVATEVLGYKRINSKPWFSDEAKVLSEEQQRLRVQVDDKQDLEKKQQLKRRRNRKLRELSDRMKHDQNMFWKERATKVAVAMEIGESRAMFAAVRFLRNASQEKVWRGVHGMLDEDGNLVTDEMEKRNLFARYFERLLNVDTTRYWDKKKKKSIADLNEALEVQEEDISAKR